MADSRVRKSSSIAIVWGEVNSVLDSMCALGCDYISAFISQRRNLADPLLAPAAQLPGVLVGCAHYGRAAGERPRHCIGHVRGEASGDASVSLGEH